MILALAVGRLTGGRGGCSDSSSGSGCDFSIVAVNGVGGTSRGGLRGYVGF